MDKKEINDYFQMCNGGLGDDLPPGSVVQMAPEGFMTTEIFIRWMKHFAKYKAVGNVLLGFDGQAGLPVLHVCAMFEGLTEFCFVRGSSHK